MNTKTTASLIGFVALVLILAISSIGYQRCTVRTVDVTVTKTDTKKKGGDGDDTYMVWTKKNGVFKNSDALFHGKFRSSDLQGKLKTGKKYRLKVYGWRIGFLSTYPNLVSAHEIKE